MYLWKKKGFKRSSNNITTSKLEDKFALLLKSLNLYYKRQHRVGYRYYDFYLPEHNLLIEVMGDYWHGNKSKYAKNQLSEMQKKNQFNDKFKRKLANAAGYKIIEFWETEINNDFIFVRKELKELTKG